MTEQTPSAIRPAETMTLEELIQALGISRSVGYRLANNDQLPVPTIRVGRRFLFSRSALNQVLGKTNVATA